MQRRAFFGGPARVTTAPALRARRVRDDDQRWHDGRRESPVDESESSSYQRFDCTGDDPALHAAATEAAREAIEAGECIVLPTDTVYGIGADAFSPQAVQRLLDAEGRGRDMPPPVLIGESSLIRALAVDVPEEAKELIERHWPGPLTIICRMQPSLRMDRETTRTPSPSGCPITRWRGGAAAFVSADGMGGALAGELASRISVQTLAELVQEGSDEERLAETIRLANRRVAERATSDPRASGMGSTVTAASSGARPSRSLTRRLARVPVARRRPHAPLARPFAGRRMGARRRTGARGAAQHPQRSVITRALGADWQIDIDVWTTPARTDDVILLCTDGLSGFVDDAAVAPRSSIERLDDVVRSLIDAANAAGGEDNITAVALGLEAEEGEAEAGAETGEAVVDERPTATLEAVVPPPAAEPVPAPAPEPAREPAPDATAVALAVPAPPVDAEVQRTEATPERLVPAPLPRPRRDPDHLPALVTGFGSGAPVRRRGRARRLGVFASVVALLLCVLWAGRFGLRWSHFVGVDPERARWRSTRVSRTTSAAASSCSRSSIAAGFPRPRCRRRGGGTSSTTPCARASRRAPSSRSSSRQSRERRRPALEPQSRARLASARRRSGGRRLHVGAGRPLGRRLHALADLRRGVPGTPRHRPRRPAHRVAERRSGAAAPAGLLVAVGIVEIYRLDPRSRATRRSGWPSASAASSPCWPCSRTTARSSATATSWASPRWERWR